MARDFGVGVSGLALRHGGDDDSQQLLPKVIQDLPPGASVLRIAAGGEMAACVRTDYMYTTLSWDDFSATYLWGIRFLMRETKMLD